ncbi:MAG: hemin ABC transporter substrate-binding protein [Proteobacteria bacterium]|nr:MAG: hemin ABC transporter substrate-binding protein [Pseudomonadota bacterium]
MIVVIKRYFFTPVLFLSTLAGLVTAFHAVANESPPVGQRIISIGGSVTEIVYALGQEGRLVARDTTSTYPAAANNLPNVGYMRRLSPEGVLSVTPDMIIAEAGSGPQETIDVLRQASVNYVEIPDGFDRDAVKTKIIAVAEALGLPKEGAELANRVDAKLAAAEKQAAGHKGKPKRVLFILSTRGGRIMASGRNTAADGIIRMAGGVNAVGDFEGYKSVTDEAIIAAAPEVILMMSRSGAEGSSHSQANEELFALPAISTTPAAKARKVIRIDGLLLLGFGPRTADAITALSEALYGETETDGETETLRQ